MEGGVRYVFRFAFDAWCHCDAVRRGSAAGGVGLPDEPTRSGTLTNDRGAGKLSWHPRNVLRLKFGASSENTWDI